MSVKLLLDTHALLWWLAGNESLSLPAREAIGEPDNDVFVSAASVWEIAVMQRRGKLPYAAVIVADLDTVVRDCGFVGLPISLRHGQLGGSLPGPHRDPFDRMLIAQALADGIVLVSNEQAFDAYGVARLW